MTSSSVTGDSPASAGALYRNDCGSVEYGRWGSTPAWSGGRCCGRNHGNPRAVKAVHGRPAVTYAEPAAACPCHLPCRVGGRRSAAAVGA